MEHYIATGSVRASHRGSIQTKPLAYPSSEAVFQHLEANTRFLLATHCPSLRSLHSRLPLQISYFKIGKSGVHINQYVHIFNEFVIEEGPCEVLSGQEFLSKKKNEYLRPDPVPQWTVTEEFVVHYIRNDTEKQEICKIPGIDIEKARDILLHMIFLRTPRPIIKRYEGLPKIFISSFGGRRYEYPNVSEDIKFQINEFVLPVDVLNLNEIFELDLPLLHPESFPLKKLSLSVNFPDDKIFENEVLKSAKCVDIAISTNREWYSTLAKLMNKTVTIRGLHIYERLIEQLIQNLIDRDIGTVLNVMSYFDDKKLNDFFRSLESSTGIKGQHRRVDGHACYNYSLDFNKELNIYCKNDLDDNCLVMKVMKAGSAI